MDVRAMSRNGVQRTAARTRIVAHRNSQGGYTVYAPAGHMARWERVAWFKHGRDVARWLMATNHRGDDLSAWANWLATN
jgi:hypothetical protein